MVGICHLTDSHHNHHGQKPTMVGICHGGNMLGNHDDDLNDDDDHALDNLLADEPEIIELGHTVPHQGGVVAQLGAVVVVVARVQSHQGAVLDVTKCNHLWRVILSSEVSATERHLASNR